MRSRSRLRSEHPYRASRSSRHENDPVRNADAALFGDRVEWGKAAGRQSYREVHFRSKSQTVGGVIVALNITKGAETGRESENGRVQIMDLGTVSDEFAADVRAGLTSLPKTLSPKYFYDDLGSILFQAICHLPEYYVTRAEDEILAARSCDIIEAVGNPTRLVELGSGAATKTRHLIRAALSRQPALDYVPIDIEPTTLRVTAEALVAEFETLSVTGLAGTFESGVAQIGSLPALDARESTLMLFLGSTIGNLDPEPRLDLLRSLRSVLRPGDALLLGADAVKSESILIPAYDDALGITAAFNRNLLVRINRELAGTFDLAGFRHMARYDGQFQRIEMHLVSNAAQHVSVAGIGLEIDFAENETIHTENSYKFTKNAIESLGREAGFELARMWTDAGGLYCDYLLTVI